VGYLESQREPFMNGCLQKVQAPEYCACGFDQFKETFADQDLSRKRPATDPLFTELKARTIAHCAAKLPEETVRRNFARGCVGGEPGKTPYCECAWGALRKERPLPDFVGDFSGSEFDAAKRSMVQQCKGTMPDDVVSRGFMRACMKGNNSAYGSCACILGKVQGKYSNEEIAAGLAHVDTTADVETCKGSQ
jgi:hypothetical protein